MRLLRLALFPLIVLALAFALQPGSQKISSEPMAGPQATAVDSACCHHHASAAPCGDACSMGAGIAMALLASVPEIHAASIAATAIASPRSWARAPVTAPPKATSV